MPLKFDIKPGQMLTPPTGWTVTYLPPQRLNLTTAPATPINKLVFKSNGTATAKFHRRKTVAAAVSVMPVAPTGEALDAAVDPSQPAVPDPSQAPQSTATMDKDRFEFIAYTGVAMIPMGWYENVIVDLSGMQIPSQSLPALLDHCPATEYVIGQTDSIKITGSELSAEGNVIAVGDEALQALELEAAGYQFQASIGCDILSREYLDAGTTSAVNGNTVTGPCTIVRQSILREISVVVCGADGNTGFAVTPQDTTQVPESNPGAPSAMQGPPAAQSAGTPVTPLRITTPEQPDELSTISALCVGFPLLLGRAIQENWTVAQTRLERLRAGRGLPLAAAGTPAAPVAGGTPAAPAVVPVVQTRPDYLGNPEVLEAAMAIRMGCDRTRLAASMNSDVRERVMNDASRREVLANAGGFRELFSRCLAAAGYDPHFGAITEEVISRAVQANRQLAHLQASGLGQTTYSIVGILSNVLNKLLLNAFLAVDQTILNIARASDVNDFKLVTRYRITDSGAWPEVGPGGEIKQGGLTEEAFNNQATTFGKMLGISRKDLINDDLGAFNQIVPGMGRTAALSVCKQVATCIVVPKVVNWYSSGNRNLYPSGAGSALSLTSLGGVVKMFLEQRDAAGNPILIVPKYLLVPPALITLARQLFKDTTVQILTSTPQIASNPFTSMYEPVYSPYLGAAGSLGATDTNWWIVCDPADVPGIEIVYVKGNRSPIIEMNEADFDTLGVRFRGYYDFGVNNLDPRAFLKSPGA